jgi:hypothetical protein
MYYASGNELSGTLYTDNVTVAGLTATSQTLGAVRPSTSFTPLPLTTINIGRRLLFWICEVRYPEVFAAWARLTI